MKVETSKRDGFEPFSVTITFENEDDARKFYDVFKRTPHAIDLDRDCQILWAINKATNDRFLS